MVKLNSKVTEVPQIGPKTQKLLEKLDIITVRDLLHHYPFRYEDRSKIKTIAEVKNEAQNILNKNEKYTIEAKLEKIENIFTRGRKRLTKAIVKDNSGEIDLIWFNMTYLKKSLRVGETYLINGMIGKVGKKISFVVPLVEKKGDKSLHMGRIVPIYPQTGGINSKWLRARINDVLTDARPKNGLEEFPPKEIQEKYKFPNLIEALINIHFPKNFSSLQKARARLGYNELFIEMMQTEMLKSSWVGKQKAVEIKLDENMEKDLKRFRSNLPFELTADQKKTTQEILKDFKEKKPMNRLLEGDVGTGKTIVAVIASLAVVKNNLNVLYMAPTEILAKQHFKTFQKFLANENVKIQLITGGNGKKGVKTIEGEHPQITIGTHALIYKKEKYEKVGLVVIDEQHRFGVEQRKKLLEYNEDKTSPHLLTMTATPIPRTLALTIYGDLEISTLVEKPNKGNKVTTKVVPKTKRQKIFEWIAKKDEPTFIVCPFIEESEVENFSSVRAAKKEFEILKGGVFKNKNLGILHGRMGSEEKNQVVKDFEDGNIDILVSTPVIEVGIDIPNATIIVIESAERYGLASLHQLRGRVGRGEKEGYCFVFTSEGIDSKGRSNSMRRLAHLEKHNSGLKLAEIDLKLRGPGEIYGVSQHGFLNFKIANLSDVKFIEQVKTDVVELTRELNKHPSLKEKMENRIKNR